MNDYSVLPLKISRIDGEDEEYRAPAKANDFVGKGGVAERMSFSPQGGNEWNGACNDASELTQGKIYERATASVTEYFTAPPKPYTEDTLLSAMEHAGKDDKVNYPQGVREGGLDHMPEDAERKGLGTPAIRASIIEKLVFSGFAERKGKSLIPSKDGINLITVLPDVLTSPLLTAEWERRLSAIAGGHADPSEFMGDI